MIIRRSDNNSYRQASQHFKYKEFFCKCSICDKQLIDEELIHRIELIRCEVNKPITITSAYRCELHNKNVQGKENSQHLYGKAADIFVTGMKGWELAKIAIKCGIEDLGVAQYWLHIGIRHDKPRLWVYPPLRLDPVKEKLKEEIKTWNL